MRILLKLSQLYTLLYQRLCIMIGYTNNNEFTPRLTFAHRTYSLDLAERNTKCATISVYLADIASLRLFVLIGTVFESFHQCHRHSVLLKIHFLDITAVYTYLSEIKMAEFLPLKREIHMFN